jgi:hypothetical protein
MKNLPIIIITILLAGIWLVTVFPLVTYAAPAAQFTSIPTPTPRSDGRIIHIAVEGDSAWRIAAIFGFTGESYNDLKTLNKWGDNPIIQPGDEIVLGFAEAGQNGVGEASPTPMPLQPTPTPEPGWGVICIILYHDKNGDSMRQGDEPSIPEGAFNITNREGTFSLTDATKGGLEHQCYEDIPEGNFNISVAAPDGYNSTTVMNYALDLKAGETHYVDFGAQPSSVTIDEEPPVLAEGRSPLIGMVGVALLLGAITLAIFGGRYLRVK